jgi:hypothetical protein
LGIYTAEKSDAASIVLRHEGEDDHSVEIHAGASGASAVGAHAPVPTYFQNQITQGKRYMLSFSAYEQVPVAPARARRSPRTGVRDTRGR